MQRVLMIVGVLLLMAIPVHADSIAKPHSYKVVTANGQYVFVMLAPLSPERDAAGWEEWFAAPIREIRRTYTVSGLYRNDGSTTPLWTVDWYAPSVEVAADGVHVLRLVSVATSPNDEAVAFFENGQLLHAYRVRDLVDVPWLLPRSVSHMRWTEDDQLQFDDGAQTYTIRTNHAEQWVFDVTTGTVIDASHPARWFGGLSLGAILVLVWGFHRMGRSS